MGTESLRDLLHSIVTGGGGTVNGREPFKGNRLRHFCRSDRRSIRRRSSRQPWNEGCLSLTAHSLPGRSPWPQPMAAAWCAAAEVLQAPHCAPCVGTSAALATSELARSTRGLSSVLVSCICTTLIFEELNLARRTPGQQTGLRRFPPWGRQPSTNR